MFSKPGKSSANQSQSTFLKGNAELEKREPDHTEMLFRVSLAIITKVVWHAATEVSNDTNLKLAVWGGLKEKNSGIFSLVILILTHLITGTTLKDLQEKLDNDMPEYKNINGFVCELLSSIKEFEKLQVLKERKQRTFADFLIKAIHPNGNKGEWYVELNKENSSSAVCPSLPWRSLKITHAPQKQETTITEKSPAKKDFGMKKSQTIFLFTHKTKPQAQAQPQPQPIPTKKVSYFSLKNSLSSKSASKPANKPSAPVDYTKLAQSCSEIAIKRTSLAPAPKEDTGKSRMQRR